MDSTESTDIHSQADTTLTLLQSLTSPGQIPILRLVSLTLRFVSLSPVSQSESSLLSGLKSLLVITVVAIFAGRGVRFRRELAEGDRFHRLLEFCHSLCSLSGEPGTCLSREQADGKGIFNLVRL